MSFDAMEERTQPCEHLQECNASSGPVDTQPGTLGQHVAAREDVACLLDCLAGDRYIGRLGRQGFERMEVGWQCWTVQVLVAVRTQDTNLRRGSVEHVRSAEIHVGA